MGKGIPWSFQKIRSGEQIQIPTFTKVAAAVAAGVTAAKFPRRIIKLYDSRSDLVAEYYDIAQNLLDRCKISRS